MSGEATTRMRLSLEERRGRVLDTAAELFYARGVHEVGMDELVRVTGLGKATVYRLFPTKDVLVGAYLHRLAAGIGAAIEGEIERHRRRPAAGLLAVLDAVEADLHRPGFRGCPFNNASIEFDDPQHPARVEARSYRLQLLGQLRELCARVDARRADVLASQLAVLIDGAYTSAAHLGADGPAHAGLQLARQLVRQASRSR